MIFRLQLIGEPVSVLFDDFVKEVGSGHIWCHLLELAVAYSKACKRANL